MKRKVIQTNYAVHIREYIKEWMEENNIPLADVDKRTKPMYGVTLTEIMESKEKLSEENAIILENVTHIPRQAWKNFDIQYQKDATRLNLL